MHQEEPQEEKRPPLLSKIASKIGWFLFGWLAAIATGIAMDYSCANPETEQRMKRVGRKIFATGIFAFLCLAALIGILWSGNIRNMGVIILVITFVILEATLDDKWAELNELVKEDALGLHKKKTPNDTKPQLNKKHSTFSPRVAAE